MGAIDRRGAKSAPGRVPGSPVGGAAPGRRYQRTVPVSRKSCSGKYVDTAKQAGGKAGGAARAAALTPEQRRRIAKDALRARRLRVSWLMKVSRKGVDMPYLEHVGHLTAKVR